MAILPMKQTVTIKRGGNLDDWGNPTPSVEITIKCRVDEGLSAITQSFRTAQLASDGQVVATARILFDKLADIRETDTIVFTNELGQTIERMPKEINVKRDVAGKPLLTEVVV